VGGPVTSIATLTTNYVRWMFLLVPSAHAVGCQEEIPPGKHRFMFRNNLIDTYLRPEFGKSSCERPNNNVCQDVYGADKNRLHHGHRKRGSNAVAICSWGHVNSFSARGHWGCTEDYSSMRGSLNSTFEDWTTIDEKVLIRRHRLLNKRSKSCKLGSAIL